MRVADLDGWNNSYPEVGFIIKKVLTGECCQVRKISRGSNDRADAIISSTFPHYYANHAATKLIAVICCVSWFLLSLSFWYQRLRKKAYFYYQSTFDSVYFHSFWPSSSSLTQT